jgi:hypothetical protein
VPSRRIVPKVSETLGHLPVGLGLFLLCTLFGQLHSFSRASIFRCDACCQPRLGNSAAVAAEEPGNGSSAIIHLPQIDAVGEVQDTFSDVRLGRDRNHCRAVANETANFHGQIAVNTHFQLPEIRPTRSQGCR